MELNIVERAMGTETDTKNRKKNLGKLGWFLSADINRNIPTT